MGSVSAAIRVLGGRGQGQTGLEGPHCRQVARAVNRPASDDRPDVGGKADHRGVAARLDLTIRWDEEERAGSGTRRAVPDIGEVVRPASTN